MKREIIFRGKVKRPDKPIFGEILPDGTWVYGELHVTNRVPHIHDTPFSRQPIDPETVGQYTGLNDSKCYPIYEGDILRVTSLQPETLGKKMNVAVEYDGGRAAFRVKNGVRFQQLGLCALENDVVIIGNIYDNPELWKGGNK